MSDTKKQYHHWMLLGTGAVILALGATTMSYAKSIISDTTVTLPTTDATKLQKIYQMGTVLLIIGIAIVLYYIWKIYKMM